ncbi:hypothetical protein Tco_0640148 [Tanacetum coccineum]
MVEYRRMLVTRPHVGIGSFDVNAATRPQVGLVLCRSQELRVPVNVSPDRRSVRHSSFVPCDHQGFLSLDKRYVRHESTLASSHDQQFSTPGIPHAPVVGGKQYYFVLVLTRTTDRDEDGKHLLICLM